MENSQIDELKNRIIELSIQCISDLKNQNIPYDAFHSELQKLLSEKSVFYSEVVLIDKKVPIKETEIAIQEKESKGVKSALDSYYYF